MHFCKVVASGVIGEKGVDVRQAGSKFVADFVLEGEIPQKNGGVGRFELQCKAWDRVMMEVKGMQSGDEVVVVGKMVTSSWTNKQGVLKKFTSMEVEAATLVVPVPGVPRVAKGGVVGAAAGSRRQEPAEGEADGGGDVPY